MEDKIEEIVEELFDCGKRYGEDLGYIKDDVLYEYRLSSIGDSKKELSQLITPQVEEAYEKGLSRGRKPYIESNKKSRAKYAKENRCRVCGAGPLTVGTLCEKHKKMQRDKQKRYLQKKRRLKDGR